MFPASRAVQLNPRTTCLRCLLRIRIAQTAAKRRVISTSIVNGTPIGSTVKPSRQWRREYFSANLPKTLQDALVVRQNKAESQEPLAPLASKDSAFQDATLQTPQTQQKLAHEDAPTSIESANSIPAHSQTSEPPYRRRKRLKTLQASEDLTLEQGHPLLAPSSTSRHQDTPNAFLPSNSASNLATVSLALPTHSVRRLLTTCLSLSKPRLSVLVVLTTAASYSLFPTPTLLTSITTTAPSLSTLTLLFLTTGTGLCSASANALNMLMEPKYDAQMSRTRNRPLVRNLISKRGAFAFAVAAGTAGVTGLYVGCNPTVAFLGAANILIYAGMYTPLKRLSVVNTWVGAIVGGIPPLMGWAAAAGQSASSTGGWREILFSESSVGGWLLAGLLFCWQFPHFNSLSWQIREEYKNAGYKMLCWTNPARNGRVALRYAVLCFPVCVGLWAVGITDSGFLLTSSVVNGWMVREAWRFWRREGGKGSARGLFWASVWHLPVVMVLAMVHKKGLWEGIWKRVVGEEDEVLELEDEEGDATM